jgi:predicted CXXCH cytochrome family protein
VSNGKNIVIILLLMVLSVFNLSAQLSPGDLSSFHSNLEGISNCTQCHLLGNKVSREKCLVCHTEVRERISSKKGFHSSVEVTGKECFACHSEHNGKNFQLIRMDIEKFNHNLTGYSLSVPHAKKDCKDCHNTKYITDKKLKEKKFTYMGVNTECLNCHTDYHKKTLKPVCLDCHNPDSFKPATKFNHSAARFQLTGKHTTVDCIKCHKVETIDGKKFQHFINIDYSNCTSCHKDPHQNKFGQDCRQCHNESSFHDVKVKGGKNFDHDKTDFKLDGKHMNVACATCHKTKLTDPLKHERCVDCHTDYHNAQFVKNGIAPDCSLCHTVNGFTLFTFTLEQHNLSTFQIRGAHEAIPCSDCHKKETKWNFKGIGNICADCHIDIHKTFIPEKYYPQSDCKNCHNESRWASVTFDHTKTAFILTGAHAKQTCRTCHFKVDTNGIAQQKFSGTDKNCTNCHTDKHFNQFEQNGITDCLRCHDTVNWKPSKFDHSKTGFILDGKHVNLPCEKCHKPQQEGSSFYVKYKLIDFKCESCHS